MNLRFYRLLFDKWFDGEQVSFFLHMGSSAVPLGSVLFMLRMAANKPFFFQRSERKIFPFLFCTLHILCPQMVIFLVPRLRSG